MADTQPHPAAPVHAHLAHIEASLALAGSLVEAGRTIDLTGLDQTAGLLCAQVLDLPAAHAAACRPALLALLEAATTLLGALHQAAIPPPRQKAASCSSPSERSSQLSQPSWASSLSSSSPAALPG